MNYNTTCTEIRFEVFAKTYCFYAKASATIGDYERVLDTVNTYAKGIFETGQVTSANQVTVSLDLFKKHNYKTGEPREL